MSSVAVAERAIDLKSALRKLGGTGTIGDVVAATGMPRDEVEGDLKELLESHRGHLAVSDSGELLYQFDPKLMTRDQEPFLTRFKRGAWSAFKKGFKVATAVVLVVYFVAFVALVIAAILASQKGDSRGGGWGGRRRGGGGGGFNNFFLWYWMFGGRGWRHRRGLYYGNRWEKTLPKDSKPPFYKKVFSFIFGPDDPQPTQLQKDRSLLRLIRARKGVLSSPELVEHTALPLPEAEEEMGRLLGAYAGEPEVSPKGEVVYTFPELMTSAHGKVTAREPNPAWMRMEYPKELTGNSSGSNALIAGMNGFNLLAGATAPWFIFPRLGITGPLAFVGLIAVPVVFSAMFFGIPLLRWFGLKRANKKRMLANVRRLLVRLVFKNSVGAVRWISSNEAATQISGKIQGVTATPKQVYSELEKLAAEFDAEVEVDDSGDVRYRFPQVREAMVESELARRILKLDQRALGEIVYSSGDDAKEAHDRETANFDRELAGAEVDLSRYLPSMDSVGFEADYEVVAMDEEAAVRR